MAEAIQSRECMCVAFILIKLCACNQGWALGALASLIKNTAENKLKSPFKIN